MSEWNSPINQASVAAERARLVHQAEAEKAARPIRDILKRLARLESQERSHYNLARDLQEFSALRQRFLQLLTTNQIPVRGTLLPVQVGTKREVGRFGIKRTVPNIEDRLVWAYYHVGITNLGELVLLHVCAGEGHHRVEGILEASCQDVQLVVALLKYLVGEDIA